MIDFDREAALTLERLLPRLTPYLPDPDERAVFHARLEQHFGAVFHLLHSLYGRRYDFFFHLEQVLITAAQMYTARPADLKALDAAREGAPAWFQSEQVVGGVCYVDRFAGTLGGLLQRLPYIEELGITYLHLMPLFRAPSDQNDDGYAVSSYREVNPALGTTGELRAVAAALRERNISLVLDLRLQPHVGRARVGAARARRRPDVPGLLPDVRKRSRLRALCPAPARDLP